jgi:hypothetical protein
VSPPQTPAGDPASGAQTAPAPAADDDSPEVAIARQLFEKRIEARLAELAVSTKAARLLLREAGAAVGVDDNGAPAIQLPDGSERPLTAESLREAGIDDALLKSTGRPGTGLLDGAAPRPVDVVAEGARSQEFFDRNRKAILNEIARRNRR